MNRLWTLLLFTGPLSTLGVAAEEKIDFNRQIRPLLSNHCVACHGPDEKQRKADLRLDTVEGALMDLGGYAAVVPGKPDESEMLLRLLSEDDDVVVGGSGSRSSTRPSGGSHSRHDARPGDGRPGHQAWFRSRERA